MSEFYGFLQGNRGVTTRCGSKKSGIMSTLKSWNNKVTIHLYKNSDEEEVMRIKFQNLKSGDECTYEFLVDSV